MDLFGRKRIAELEQALATEKACIEGFIKDIEAERQKIATLEASELRLMGQIRDLDTAIFQMTQCTTEAQLWAIVREIAPAMECRRRLESDRIASVLIPEMQKAYRPEAEALKDKFPSGLKGIR